MPPGTQELYKMGDTNGTVLAAPIAFALYWLSKNVRKMMTLSISLFSVQDKENKYFEQRFSQLTSSMLVILIYVVVGP